jgi:hypothetical protein
MGDKTKGGLAAPLGGKSSFPSSNSPPFLQHPAERTQPEKSARPQRGRFLLRLEPIPGTDGIRALRALLKTALRRFGLRALSVEERP